MNPRFRANRYSITLIVLSLLALVDPIQAQDLRGRWQREGFVRTYTISGDSQSGYALVIAPEGVYMQGVADGRSLVFSGPYNPDLLTTITSGVTREDVLSALWELDTALALTFRSGDGDTSSVVWRIASFRVEEQELLVTNPERWTASPAIPLTRDNRVTFSPGIILLGDRDVRVQGGAFPSPLPANYVTIEDTEIAAVGRAFGNPYELGVTLATNQPAEPGHKAVEVGSVRLEERLHAYRLTPSITLGSGRIQILETDASGAFETFYLGSEETVTVAVKTDPEDAAVTVRASWEWEPFEEDTEPLDWLVDETPNLPPAVMRLAFDGGDRNRVRLRGERPGRGRLSAAVTIERGTESVSGAIEIPVVSEREIRTPEIQEIVATALCPSDRQTHLFVYGSHLDLVTVPENALGPQITVRELWRSDGNPIGIIHLQADFQEGLALDSRRLTLRHREQARQNVVSPGWIEFYAIPTNDNFKSAFRFDSATGPPRNLQTLLNNLIPEGLPNSPDIVFRGMTELRNQIELLIEESVPQPNQRLYQAWQKHGAARRTLTERSRWPEWLQQEMGNDVRRIETFYGALAGGYFCEFNGIVARIETNLRARVEDYLLDYSPSGEAIASYENLLAALVLAGTIDLDDAETYLTRARERARAAEARGESVDLSTLVGDDTPAMMATIAPGLLLGAIGSPGTKRFFDDLVDAMRGAGRLRRGLGVKRAASNSLHLFRANPQFARRIEDWDLEEQMGLLRLAGDQQGARYALRMIDDLGEVNARAIFKSINHMESQVPGARINSEGLRLLRSYNGNRALSREFSDQLVTAANRRTSRQAGDAAEARALGRWREDPRFANVEDLNDSKFKKGRGGSNMPVIDAVHQEGGANQLRRFASIANGSLRYSISKFEKLLGIKNHPLDRRKFDQMMGILRENFNVRNHADFVRRAELRIPQSLVEPLRAVIASRYASNATYRNLRIMRSGGRVESVQVSDLLDMIKPLPTSR